MKVLYINANPKSEESSYSSQVGRYFMNQLKESDSFEEVNVYNDNVPFIDGEVIDAWTLLGQGTDFSKLSQSQQGKISRMKQLLIQFKEADQYVISYPLWNLSITPMLKAYIDNVIISGETFKYGSNGPIGLLENKKALIIQASGGIYSSKEGKSNDFGSGYVVNALKFIGVNESEVVYVEGTAMQIKTKEVLLNEAYQEIDTYLK